jgi:hypothetical protein
MRIQNATNDNITIKARNEQDYARALAVAGRMVESNSYLAISSEDPYEYWVQLTATWRLGQTSDILDAYKEAKTSLIMSRKKAAV